MFLNAPCFSLKRLDCTDDRCVKLGALVHVSLTEYGRLVEFQIDR